MKSLTTTLAVAAWILVTAGLLCSGAAVTTAPRYGALRGPANAENRGGSLEGTSSADSDDVNEEAAAESEAEAEEAAEELVKDSTVSGAISSNDGSSDTLAAAAAGGAHSLVRQEQQVSEDDVGDDEGRAASAVLAGAEERAVNAEAAADEELAIESREQASKKNHAKVGNDNDREDDNAARMWGKEQTDGDTSHDVKRKDKEVVSKNNPSKPKPASRESERVDPVRTDPYQEVYDNAFYVAKDLELRSAPEFYPEGTHESVDMSENAQHRNDAMFNQNPDVFKDCILIRDVAEPLRVGSSIAVDNRREKPDREGEKGGGSAGGGVPRGKKLPPELLLAKGGVRDVDLVPGQNGSATMQASMFAFLRSVAGQVTVVPNGPVTRWSSKKKVPIAGYLCTGDSGPVLHTLPTPCLGTSINEDGLPQVPLAQSSTPRSPSPALTPTPSEQSRDDSKPTPLEPAPPTAAPSGSPSPAPQPVFANVDGEKQTAQVGGASGPPVPAVQPGGASGRAIVATPLFQRQIPEKETQDEARSQDVGFTVWVGDQRLEFSSKQKADRFCKRLSERIAADMGDTEWNADDVAPKLHHKKDITVTSFLQTVRKAAPDWTLGVKTLLVVVMDWMNGDNSIAPLSRQRLSPSHYGDKVFPRVREAFQKMSYGQFDLKITIVPQVVQYTRPRSRYAVGGYPFPALYNGARDSVLGTPALAGEYNFDNYDLVYVIAPQQAPTGTKGVAWVGAKGAMCNGCEEISENFQVMVAVHELGHNLGLMHASSSSLEYGNVFDWMGNYPDVQGLSYGVGYKEKLRWLPSKSIASITDGDVHGMNTEFLLRPFDSQTPPRTGELTGIRINLKDNDRNVYIAYRSTTTSMQRGVYVTLQDRETPDSELIDMACHSPSQQDASLRTGWTFVEPSSKLAIHVIKVEEDVASVHIFEVTSSKILAAIRARAKFSDGHWKCPRVCTDSDLLVSNFNGCKGLARDGYCRGGSITMSGTKYSIPTTLCPSSCNACKEATSGSPEVGAGTDGGCSDKEIKIGGMSCAVAAARGFCSRDTNMGNIGKDLCRSSCRTCPPKPPTNSANADSFENPIPAKMVGSRSAAEDGASEMIPDDPAQQAAEEETQEEEEEREAEKSDAEESTDKGETEDADEEQVCTDDVTWRDADNDGCEVYAEYIKKGTLTRKEACNYNTGAAKSFCRKTCNTCEAKSSTCQDKECVTKWKEESGKCYVCSDWQSMCELDFFRADCPATCNMCSASSRLKQALKEEPVMPVTIPPTTTTTTTTTIGSTTQPGVCRDHDCVGSWLQKTGKCFRCKDFAKDFCGRSHEFMESCPRSCKMCSPNPQKAAKCADHFKIHTCRRFVTWGWCGQRHVAKHCTASCNLCDVHPQKTRATPEPPARSRASPHGVGVGMLGTLLACVLVMWR